MVNREALHTLIATELAHQSTDVLLRKAESCRIPLGVVLSLEQVLADPHLEARQFWQSLHVDNSGPVYTPAYPFLQGDVSNPKVSRGVPW